MPSMMKIPALWENHGQNTLFSRRIDMLTAPAIKASFALEKRQSICQNARKSTHDHREDPETREPLADFEAGIPASNQIGAARQEAGLEDTQERSADGQGTPMPGKSHTDENRSEADAEEGEPVCWTGAREDEVLRGPACQYLMEDLGQTFGRTLGISKRM